MRLRFALVGAGRIGRLHAANLASHPQTSLATVFDVDPAAAQAVAELYSARPAYNLEETIQDGIDAVLIASSTDTHCAALAASVQAGKAVLCEKPIDLDIDQVDRCWKEIQHCSVPIQVGFNRRYDPSHRAVFDAVRKGDIGRVELILLTSRDPSPPSLEYLKVSGGIFRDMMIHDLDLARFLLAEEPTEIFATASTLVNDEIGAIGDVDTAMVILRTSGGVLCHINNSRRAVYGYDQRVEVFGSGGMVRSDNLRATSVKLYTSEATGVQDPLLRFFIERYAESYRLELDDFVRCVMEDREPGVTFEDGARALQLANAAVESLQTGRLVKLPKSRWKQPVQVSSGTETVGQNLSRGGVGSGT